MSIKMGAFFEVSKQSIANKVLNYMKSAQN